ncbi:MAG: PGF-pre-PGF domain-containing protein, partial [Nanoarchaeota archaeon]|nr:PGF-pre-PGF domain-containing protein [Nanoarchaeota archaeon]
RNMTFNWTVADNLDVNISCNLTIDGSYNLTDGYGVANGSNGIVTVYNLAESIHWWNITCWDEVGNSNTSETRNFTVDLSNPSVTLGVSNLTWFKTGTSILLNVTATDASLSKCDLWADFNGTFMFNQTVNATSGTKVNFAALNLTQGTYKWNVQCNDTLSNQAFASTNNTFYVDLTNPSASVSLSATSISTYGAVTITCGATDTQDSAPTSGGPSVSLPDGTVSADTDGTFSDTVASGTYTATCTATDASGRTASTSSTFTVSGVSSSGGSSSSGVVSSTKETHTVTLSSNPVTIKISKPNEMGINEIELIAKEEISNVKFSVEKFSGKPADVDKADGEVLYYLNIDAPMAQGKLKQAKIRFDVSKKWMDDKNIGSSEIVMMKFTDKWVNLKTSEIGGTADAKTFEAITSGFSFFVITTRTQEAVEEVEEVQKETKPAVVSKEAVDEVEGVEKGSKGWLLVTVIILALVMVGVLLYSKKDWLMNLMPRKDDDGVNKALRRRISRKLKK